MFILYCLCLYCNASSACLTVLLLSYSTRSVALWYMHVFFVLLLQSVHLFERHDLKVRYKKAMVKLQEMISMATLCTFNQCTEAPLIPYKEL